MKATSDKDDIYDADDGDVGGGGDDSEHAVDLGDESNLRHLAFDHILQGNNPQFSALTMNNLDKDDQDLDLDGNYVEDHGDDDDGIFRMLKGQRTWKTMVQLGTQLLSKMIVMMEMMVSLVVMLRMQKRMITWKTMVQLGTQLWSKMILMMEMMVRLMVGVRMLKRMFINLKTMVQLKGLVT